MIIPPKKTQEQIAQENEILRNLYQSSAWKLYKSILYEEMSGVYSSFPALKSWEDTVKAQGYLQGLQKAHSMDANVKK